METHAAHQHSESCYTVQGAHSHSGDSVNSGCCYTTLKTKTETINV